MNVIALFARLPTWDRVFVPLFIVMGLARLVDGFRDGLPWAFGAGVGFLLYAIATLWQHQEGAPLKLTLSLKMAGVGLWLASMLWRMM